MPNVCGPIIPLAGCCGGFFSIQGPLGRLVQELWFQLSVSLLHSPASFWAPCGVLLMDPSQPLTFLLYRHKVSSPDTEASREFVSWHRSSLRAHSMCLPLHRHHLIPHCLLPMQVSFSSTREKRKFWSKDTCLRSNTSVLSSRFALIFDQLRFFPRTSWALLPHPPLTPLHIYTLQFSISVSTLPNIRSISGLKPG